MPRLQWPSHSAATSDAQSSLGRVSLVLARVSSDRDILADSLVLCMDALKRVLCKTVLMGPLATCMSCCCRTPDHWHRWSYDDGQGGLGIVCDCAPLLTLCPAPSAPSRALQSLTLSSFCSCLLFIPSAAVALVSSCPQLWCVPPPSHRSYVPACCFLAMKWLLVHLGPKRLSGHGLCYSLA